MTYEKIQKTVDVLYAIMPFILIVVLIICLFHSELKKSSTYNMDCGSVQEAE